MILGRFGSSVALESQSPDHLLREASNFFALSSEHLFPLIRLLEHCLGPLPWPTALAHSLGPLAWPTRLDHFPGLSAWILLLGDNPAGGDSLAG